ncbi:MAG: zf-HC2 domain-containing protein [candidate division NC10 bacterium]|nr:zf-HC2 domain-containing protein [candidate division NC10 bacterium]
MRCRVARGLLREMARGAVSSEDRATLQGHLETCPRCAREARALEATRRLLGALVEGEGPSSAFCRLPWGKLAESREGRAEGWIDAFALFAPRLIPAAAVMVVLLGGLTYLFQPLEPRRVAPLDRYLEASGVVPQEMGPLSETTTLTQDDVLALVLLRDEGVVAR